MHFFLRIFDEFFSGFRAKFQKIMTCVAFSIKFAKTNQKFAENSEFCANYSLLFKIIHWFPYSHLAAFLFREEPYPAEVEDFADAGVTAMDEANASYRARLRVPST